MTIGDWLARREQLTPDKVALIDTLNGGRAITYSAWNRSANRTAHLLHSLGVRPGDRVAVLAMNCVEYLDIWFACGKLGAILQTLNWRLAPVELQGLIADGQPCVLVYGPEFAATVPAILPAGADAPRCVALGEPVDARHARFSARDTAPDGPLPPPDLAWDDPWVICYTGGTTGLPKGALLTYRSITANSVNTIVSWGLTPGDVAILNSPLFHTGGLNVFTAPLVHLGGTSIVCRQFDPDQVYDLIEGAGVTLFFGVPTMFIALQQHPRWSTAPFSRLKVVISGGAPCPQPVFEKFWERGVDFKAGYGLTEAGPNNFWLPASEVRRKPGAVGFPLFHVETRIVNDSGQECPPDETGELLLRGEHVCAGYWNRPEATAAMRLPGGWLRTGDLARRDDGGCHTIVGRSKDMIISGGENIYPAEVENVLAAHPAVVEASLIAVPDPHWGEVGRAIVVVRAGAKVDAKELIAFCRERLARFKIPKTVVFTTALPHTGAGKIDKKALAEQFGHP
jgi:fatty-acyl-CoA synthase